jgi:nucleotide-binding universal stress UspA family protein
MASIKFRKSITIQKAVKTALTFLGLFAAGVATVQIPEDPGAFETAAPALETAWATYERLETRKAELEAAKERARADERAAIEAELRRLEPEIREAAERLGLYVPD